MLARLVILLFVHFIRHSFTLVPRGEMVLFHGVPPRIELPLCPVFHPPSITLKEA